MYPNNATAQHGANELEEGHVFVPGLSGFLKRAWDSISSRGGVALMFEPQPIGGKPTWLGFPHRAGRCRSEKVRVPSPVD